jgi:hypothetical protein
MKTQEIFVKVREYSKFIYMFKILDFEHPRF